MPSRGDRSRDIQFTYGVASELEEIRGSDHDASGMSCARHDTRSPVASVGIFRRGKGVDQLLWSDAIQRRRQSWQAARDQLDEIAGWCRTVAGRLEDLTYAQKRLVLEALGVQVKVWPANHTPRWQIEARVPFSDARSRQPAGSSPAPGTLNTTATGRYKYFCRRG